MRVLSRLVVPSCTVSYRTLQRVNMAENHNQNNTVFFFLLLPASSCLFLPLPASSLISPLYR